MVALTVRPGHADSARLEEVPDLAAAEGSIVARTIAIGVCGTDSEILHGEYGWPPSETDRLVIGHESIAVVESAPRGSGFAAGELIAGIVRRPDPVPCRFCAVGEWDTCRNGRYTVCKVVVMFDESARHA
jgi:threonine dehydrogenase-like Zn-dependent dehydrogenase